MSISKRDKRIIMILTIFTIVFTFFGASLAYWNWETTSAQKTNIVFKLTQDFSCAADGGGDITQADAFIAPAKCTSSTHAIKREVKVTPTINRSGLSINIDLWLNVKSMGTGLKNSQNFKYALTTNENSCTEGVIESGTFKGTSQGSQVPLLNKNYSSSTPQTYYLYVWLDEVETSLSTMDQKFSLSIGGECFDQTKPEAPVLDEGMIPVTLSSDGTVTTVLEDDDSWYDYENKEWANVVLVDNDSRNTYKNTTGVTVDQNDILAYYVWIPRYKYQIWTTSKSSVGKEQTIDIVFESASESMVLGTQAGEYRTHPAFWWDDNSDGNVDSGEMIAGIWVGKFETSVDKTSTCYTSANQYNCNNANQLPRIVPNVQSLRYQNVSNQFLTSQKFSESENIYGLSNTSTNAHMMKNSEWGAVAYLSHSVYGINGEIRINNNSNFMTGCGASEENGESTSACEISYNSSSSPQSTTGNITGLYDMSGGSYEYVMGNYNNTITDSGFSSLPDGKYYDLYTSDGELTACNGGICYGHALSETAGWYEDNIDLGYSGNRSWSMRGGYHTNGSIAGPFFLFNLNGLGYNFLSWRSVLVVGYGP